MFVNHLVLLVIIVFNSVYSLQENPKILVIGSGPAGIAAATRLWKSNFTNLQVLEAEQRIGGRINSVKFGDAFVDMGGEWCDGENTIVYNMVKEYNVLKHRHTPLRLLYSNGSYLGDDVFDSLRNFADSIDASVGDQVEKRCIDLNSTGACFDRTFNSTFSERYRNDPDRLNIILEAVDWLQNYMVYYDSSNSLYDLYRKSDYRRAGGDWSLSWEGRGYKTILEVMMQKFPDPSRQLPIDANILLNKEVARISWNSSHANRVSVDCSDNSSFEADHVIFTPSLGVLKENYNTMFEPGLPNEKVNTIRTAGFGAILKIILHFNETWWYLNEEQGLIWSTEDRNLISREFGRGPVKDGRSWLTTLVTIVPAENNPNVIIIFFAGNMVPDIEREDNEVLKDGCVYLLKKFFGKNHTIIEPDSMIKTTWSSNPHFRGTYAYDSIEGNSVQHKFPDKLAAPLVDQNGRPIVQFAGEATHPHYFSTVHGAIETGYREADRLINFYKHH